MEIAAVSEDGGCPDDLGGQRSTGGVHVDHFDVGGLVVCLKLGEDFKHAEAVWALTAKVELHFMVEEC